MPLIFHLQGILKNHMIQSIKIVRCFFIVPPITGARGWQDDCMISVSGNCIRWREGLWHGNEMDLLSLGRR
jgi:hypothetical protein